MRQYKRVFSVFPAWSYQKEIEELNRLSEQGWQLVRGGMYSAKYKLNSDVQYRYQIEYSRKVEDLPRYIETFREQGWEYINTTLNGWSYFRKAWDPAIPEEQYEIYTDQPSLREMTGRWIKLVAVLTAIIAAFTVYNAVSLAIMPKLPTLILLLTYLLETAFLLRGILLMRTQSKNRAYKWEKALFMAFWVTVLMGCGSYAFLERPRHFRSISSAEEMSAIPAEIENAMEWLQFDIPYTDNYYIDLDFTADSPMCFSIINDSSAGSGAVVYTVTGSSMGISRTKLHLDKGSYRVYFSDYDGGSLILSFSLR